MRNNFFVLSISLFLLLGAGCTKSNYSGNPSATSLTEQSPLDSGEPVNDRVLIGAWKVVAGVDATTFESIIINDDGIYYTHLNNRPLDEGRWTLENNKLTLNSGNDESWRSVFENVTVAQGDWLLLYKEGAKTVWERTK